MALQLALISDSITRYGEVLFTLVNEAGTFRSTDAGVTVRDNKTFAFEGGYIAPIRSAELEKGFDTASDREWKLGEFEASRDYEFNGVNYLKGRRVLFVY